MDGTFSVNTDSLRTAKTHYDSASNGMNNQESFTASGFGDSQSWADNVCSTLGTSLSDLATKASQLASTLSTDAECFDSTDRDVQSDIQCATSSDH